jgi:trypsin
LRKFFDIILDAFAKNERIVGGSSINISEFPFQASIRIFHLNEHICGATIITHRHVVSAAHCIYDDRNNFSQIRVIVGANSARTILSSYKILNIDVHPDFTGIKNQREYVLNDISVITVGQWVQILITFYTCINYKLFE